MRISDMVALTAAEADESDLIEVVDMSETGDARNKKMALGELVAFLRAQLALDEQFYELEDDEA